MSRFDCHIAPSSLIFISSWHSQTVLTDFSLPLFFSNVWLTTAVSPLRPLTPLGLKKTKKTFLLQLISKTYTCAQERSPLSERLTTGWENEPASHPVGGQDSYELWAIPVCVCLWVCMCGAVIPAKTPLRTDCSAPQANLNEQVLWNTLTHTLYRNYIKSESVQQHTKYHHYGLLLYLHAWACDCVCGCVHVWNCVSSHYLDVNGCVHGQLCVLVWVWLAGFPVLFWSTVYPRWSLTRHLGILEPAPQSCPSVTDF